MSHTISMGIITLTTGRIITIQATDIAQIKIITTNNILQTVTTNSATLDTTKEMIGI